MTRKFIEEIKAAPESVRRETLDFMLFLKARQSARAEGSENLPPVAQSARAADLNAPEERESWRELGRMQ